jgi:hypothetical protein
MIWKAWITGGSMEATVQRWACSMQNEHEQIKPLFLQERMAQSTIAQFTLARIVLRCVLRAKQMEAQGRRGRTTEVGNVLRSALLNYRHISAQHANGLLAKRLNETIFGAARQSS